MLEGTAIGSIGFKLGPSGMFESMIHASSLASGILLESGGRVARCGRISSGNTDETTSANACLARQLISESLLTRGTPCDSAKAAL
jgi:hypothetical protein